MKDLLPLSIQLISLGSLFLTLYYLHVFLLSLLPAFSGVLLHVDILVALVHYLEPEDGLDDVL